VIDRRRPGRGYRHLLTVADVRRFLQLLPDWSELSCGLDAVVLAPGERRLLGWHRRGIVALCAWDRDVEREWHADFVEEHRDVLDRLGVERLANDPPWEVVQFTERSARGFQLMHVLLHELGHHHDRMTTRSRRSAGRGEGYAEAYALRYAEGIWERYFREFGW
jgi:hypothetical protein